MRRQDALADLGHDLILIVRHGEVDLAIRKQAKERIHRAIDRSVSQIRPLLTSDQQARLDKVEKARQDLLTAEEELRVALNE